MTKKNKCETCGKPTDFKGWYFVQKEKSLLKEYHWWCREHFRVRMFNSFPFICSDNCNNKRLKRLGLAFRKNEDHYVWLDGMLSSEIDENIKGQKLGRGEVFTMKPSSPKCPWCGKKMKPVFKGKNFLF